MLLWSIVELSVYLSGGLTPATETDLFPAACKGGDHLTLRYIFLPFFIRNSPEGCPGQRCKVSSYFLCCLPGKSGIRGPLRCLPAGRSPFCGSVPIQRVFVLPALCRSSGEKVTDLNRYAVIGQIRVRLFIQGFRKHTCPHL